MNLSQDPLLVQLRRSLRAGLTGLPAEPGIHGAPVNDGADGPARPVLEALGAADFERPAEAGGLGLGLTAGVVVSEELGRAARGNAYRAMNDDTLAGLEALPLGSGVTLTNGGLTGAATVDDASAETLLVAARTDDGPVLAAVRRGAEGLSTDAACWPPVVRFEGTPAEVRTRLDDSVLAGPRLRQAAYLLGIAEGAHRIAVGYAGRRKQFGTRLRDLPAVSFPLARGVVALNATRAAVYRGAWLADSEPEAVGTAPIEALAMAAETARSVVRVSMQSCGVRAMTAELGLHRYFRLAGAEATRYGDPAALWRAVGAEIVRTARQESARAQAS